MEGAISNENMTKIVDHESIETIKENGVEISTNGTQDVNEGDEVTVESSGLKRKSLDGEGDHEIEVVKKVKCMHNEEITLAEEKKLEDVAEAVESLNEAQDKDEEAGEDEEAKCDKENDAPQVVEEAKLEEEETQSKPSKTVDDVEESTEIQQEIC